MRDPDRDVINARAWLTPRAPRVCGVRMRPFSLGSLILCPELEIVIGDDGLAGIDPDFSATVYAWAHAAPLDDVLWALQSGMWEAMAEAWELAQGSSLFGLLSELDAYLRKMAPMIVAAEIDVREKPRRSGEDDDTPSDVLEPFWLSAYVGAIGDVCNLDPAAIVWETPLPQALQLLHTSIRRGGAWTVLPGEQAEQVEVAPEVLAEIEAAPVRLGADADAETLAWLDSLT